MPASSLPFYLQVTLFVLLELALFPLPTVALSSVPFFDLLLLLVLLLLVLVALLVLIFFFFFLALALEAGAWGKFSACFFFL